MKSSLTGIRRPHLISHLLYQIAQNRRPRVSYRLPYLNLEKWKVQVQFQSFKNELLEGFVGVVLMTLIKEDNRLGRSGLVVS
jgi:hypothetical protein